MKLKLPHILTVFAVFSGCEIPGAPDFKVEQRISTPLLMEKRFELIGGKSALLDTTTSDLDSLFYIDGDGLVSISQEFDLNLGDLENALPVLDIEPTSFESSIGEISIDDFSAAFGSALGVLKQDAQETGTVNIEFGALSGPLPAIELTPPSTPDLEVANAGFNFAVLENAGSDPQVNFIVLNFTNNTSVPLTNASRTGLPSITLNNSDGQALGGTNVTFALESNPSATALQPGETGIARLNIRGAKLTKRLSYVLSLGTTGGMFNSGGNVGLKAITTELRFTEASTNVDPQSGISLNSVTKLDGDFVNAIIEDGFLTLTLNNDTPIPLTLNTLKVLNTNDFVSKTTGRRFKAGSTVVEEFNVVIDPKSNRVLNFELDGKAISSDLTVEVDAQTAGTATSVSVKSTDAFNYDIQGGLSVKSATARLDAQTFRSSQTFDFANEEFDFNGNTDYVQLKAGTILIENLVNGIDLTLDTLQISFPTILKPSTPGVYTAADSLVIRFSGANKIIRSRDAQSITLPISLAGCRITALNNQLRFNIFGKSENTKNLPAPDSIRVVRATDNISAIVRVSGLEIERAVGNVSTKTFTLSTDAGNDGILDLLNPDEAQVTKISALNSLSENIDDILFSNPAFTMFLSHNIGVDAVVYMAIQGKDPAGNDVYLTGNAGSPFEVTSSDNVTGLKIGGADIPKSNLLKIYLNRMEDINANRRDIVFPFNKTTTNVDLFLSNLPSEIRVIGKAILSPAGGQGFVKQPVTFTSKMGIDIPVNFATSPTRPVSVDDTVKIDFGDLPGPGDDTQLEEGSLYIAYKNGLPLAIKVELDFLDEFDQVITKAPDVSLGQGSMTLRAGTIDPATRFVSGATEDVFVLGLTTAQLSQLNRARKIRLYAAISSAANEEIKLRAQDYVSVRISANFKAGTVVN